MLVKDCTGKMVDASRFWIEADRIESGQTWFYVCCEHCRDYFFVERISLSAFQNLDEAFLVLEELRDGLKAEEAESQPVSAEGCP